VLFLVLDVSTADTNKHRISIMDTSLLNYVAHIDDWFINVDPHGKETEYVSNDSGSYDFYGLTPGGYEWYGDSDGDMFAVSVLNPHAKDMFIADTGNHRISLIDVYPYADVNCDDDSDSGLGQLNMKKRILSIGIDKYNGKFDKLKLYGLTLGSYTLTVSKYDDLNSLDASKICRCCSRALSITCFQKVAGDVTQNGEILSTDASQIANILYERNENIDGGYAWFGRTGDILGDVDARIISDLGDIESINSAEAATSKEKRILSIGINKYSGKFEKLRFAVSDAIKISEAFNKYGYKSSTLKNNTAGKSNILDELFHEVPGDTFVLYIAGHGFSDINGDLFVVPYSNGKRYPVISLSEINSILSYHKGKTYALIDTCFDRKEVDLNSYIQNLSVGIKDNQTTFILASNTKAIESNSFQSGLMTYSILKYLEGSLDINSDDMLNISDFGLVGNRLESRITTSPAGDFQLSTGDSKHGSVLVEDMKFPMNELPEKIDFQKLFSYISRNTKKLSLSKFQYNQSPLNLDNLGYFTRISEDILRNGGNPDSANRYDHK